MIASTKMIKSARRVLEVLEFFDHDHPTATVMDIARTLGYPQSSTSELLRCLVMLGYLNYNRYSRIYSPTVRVGLLGAWVAPKFFRDGLLLRTIDAIAESTGQTVVLSTASNYAVQHIHVVPGSHADSTPVHVSDTGSLLHTIQGQLLLSSYSPSHVRSAIHRLNADEPVTERRVRLQETLDHLANLRIKGWAVDTNLEAGRGAIALLLPPRSGGERIVLSVIAPVAVIESRADEIRELIKSTGLCAAPPRRAANEAMAETRAAALRVGARATRYG